MGHQFKIGVAATIAGIVLPATIAGAATLLDGRTGLSETSERSKAVR